MMTNNLDQFDQSPDFDEGTEDRKSGGGLSNIKEAWRTRPIFKLVAILVGVGALAFLFVSLTASKPEADQSIVKSTPQLKEAPGGKASPAFIDAQAQANEQKIKEAASTGGTAIPMPLPSGVSPESRKESDPLVEFRAEMQKQKEEQQRQIQALRQQNQQQQQVSIQQDQQVQEKLGQALQQQMRQLADLWKPQNMTVINGMVDAVKPDSAKSQDRAAGTSAVSPSGKAVQNNGLGVKVKPLILAGTVNYAQMLTEANTDVPGPIMAQILSGPLSGARALGSFKSANDYLILNFTLATLKGKEYKIQALALDPETTLGGMATEVDHRYFARVVLPAAASFISAFGQKLSEKPTNTVVTQGGTVITEQAENGIKDGLYAGMGSAGQSIASFFASEAANTKVLVRVAVGTPLGLFFVESVCSGEYPCAPEKNSGDSAAASGDVRTRVIPAGAPAPVASAQ